MSSTLVRGIAMLCVKGLKEDVAAPRRLALLSVNASYPSKVWGRYPPGLRKLLPRVSRERQKFTLPGPLVDEALCQFHSIRCTVRLDMGTPFRCCTPPTPILGAT